MSWLVPRGVGTTRLVRVRVGVRVRVRVRVGAQVRVRVRLRVRVTVRWAPRASVLTWQAAAAAGLRAPCSSAIA